MDKNQLKQLRRQIVIFMDLLSGDSDNKFTLPEENQIYLRGMALGWVMAQPWYDAYQRQQRTNHRNENVELTLSEGVIHDIIMEETHGNPDFDMAMPKRKAKAA
jgi:hypothetical protein